MQTNIHTETSLLLTRAQWLAAVVAGAICAAGGFPWYADISLWIGAALFIVGVVSVHLVYASRSIIALPQIAILIAALQYVLAAWLNYYLPPSNPLFDIGGALPSYLSYAGPVLLALVFGWGAAIWGLHPQPHRPHAAGTRLLFQLDVLYGLGLVATLMGNVFEVQSVAFAMLLFGNLRYVGLYGRMLSRGPGWTWRLAILATVEVLFATGGAMFHDLLLWSVWTFAMWIYCFAPPRRMVVGALVAAVILLPALQESKWQLREHVVDEPAVAFGEPAAARVVSWLSYIIPSVIRSATFETDRDFLAETAVRYNQGWIINRVMIVVPDAEPFARGGTLADSAVAALLPRFLAPNKVSAGGRENMFRFAGMELNETTAMNLGYAGEMYANFGHIGGIVGCASYALGLGALFRVIYHRASKRPLWWSIVPFIFYASLKAEDDIAFVLNWTSKACVVAAVAVFVLPSLRRAFFGGTSSVALVDVDDRFDDPAIAGQAERE